MSFKLLDHEGNVLGLLSVPTWVSERLSARGNPVVTVHRVDPKTTADVPDGSVRAWVQSFGLRNSEHVPGGIVAMGIMLQDLERQPGFQFAAGSDYVHRLISGYPRS